MIARLLQGFAIAFALATANATPAPEAVLSGKPHTASGPDATTHQRVGRGAKGDVTPGTMQVAQAPLDDQIQVLRRQLEAAPQSADAHFNLGVALRRAGKLDDAIAEYRKAISLNSRDSRYRNMLGAALRAAGKPEEAIEQLRSAIALDPENATAHSNLGNLLSDQGKFAAAVAEYHAGLKTNPQNAYIVLRLHLARVSAGEDDRAELTDNAAALGGAGWPSPLVAHYLGTLSADAVRRSAASSTDTTERAQQCEANYYIGSLALREGRPVEARPSLEAAANDCPADFVEAVGAKIELEHLPPR
jgi:tetratricopeptide (TPR) repeat protein